MAASGHATHEACDNGGQTFRHLTLTATGDAAGRTFFLATAVYPYAGPGTYALKALPPTPIEPPPTWTPDPILGEVPAGYPAFLNFVPKFDPGNAFADRQTEQATSRMGVDADEKTGWFDLQMDSVNAKTGAPTRLRVTGRFVCGPPFQIED